MSREISEDGTTKWRCVTCDTEFKKAGHIKQHIESKHITGVMFTCLLCSHVCKTRSALAMHKSRMHKNV